jgi:hypothetical protein
MMRSNEIILNCRLCDYCGRSSCNCHLTKTIERLEKRLAWVTPPYTVETLPRIGDLILMDCWNGVRGGKVTKVDESFVETVCHPNKTEVTKWEYVWKVKIVEASDEKQTT